MTCNYCGTRNAEDAHRCHRCGRTPRDARAASVTTGALAKQLEPAALSMTAAAGASQSSPRFSRAIQGSLFPQHLASSNVIPIEAYAPARPRPDAPPKAPQKVPRAGAARTSARRGQAVSEKQERLEFLPADPAPKKLSTTVDAKVYCDAPVAHVVHRAVASALDWTMVLIAYGVFLGAFAAMGGQIVFARINVLLFVGVLLMIAFTYGLLWALAGRETPGMRWTHLRLITFDGFPLDGKNRTLRLAGSCLSFSTGIGILWALADEEGLTWPDHISGTFPTPLAHETATFRRGSSRA